MTIFEARETIAAALDGEAQSLWVGLEQDSKNAWAEDLAYGEATLDEVVSKFNEWVNAVNQEAN